MIKTTAMLLEELKGYGSPKSKLARMAERGECFPITRGLYETDRNAPAYLLAGSIYAVSYTHLDVYKRQIVGIVRENGLTIEQLAALMEMLEKRPTAALPDEYRKTEEFMDEE